MHASGADTAWIVAPDLALARAASERIGLPRVELELDALEGRAGDALGAAVVTRVRTRSVEQTIAALAIAGAFEVLAPLDRDHAQWLAGQGAWPARLALVQPTYELASEASERDVAPDDLGALAQRFTDAPIEGVPACLLGRAPRAASAVLDTTMLAPEGGLEIFRYARRFVHAHDRVKSLRCRACVHEPGCAGVHVNWVRAHGFAALQPVESS